MYLILVKHMLMTIHEKTCDINLFFYFENLVKKLIFQKIDFLLALLNAS